MKSRLLISVLWLLMLILLVSCSKDEREESKEALLISSAVSMKGALEEIKSVYEKENQKVTIQFNYGSSGALATQISQGAPVDVYISAATEPFEKLVQAGKIDRDFHSTIAGNKLVLIQNKNSGTRISRFEELERTDLEKIAIGTPETVPAGKYAREVLENLDLWERLKGKLVLTKDVGQVASYVETGNVDAGIVYKTDVLGTDKIVIREEAAESLHSPIVYPAGVLEDSENKQQAEQFYKFLSGKKASAILEEHGFLILK
ncbi:hypothetical protein AM500_20990 [Bacillus sp. FJAT-18017]|uniref:molybdate ABC transporter substrate-binding protein n=1 Tax=Bacillus sp. FJAT-18017 TaxID=1705566 RepID=UPI0006ADF46B|nr:molybdate ABC transporter substrate-binding protein [Bacillus sp. FJAT-18017]ALC91990.1 hypothetical protein AM500_20990 [Bacillus sp. FJAT-18017]